MKDEMAAFEAVIDEERTRNGGRLNVVRVAAATWGICVAAAVGRPPGLVALIVAYLAVGLITLVVCLKSASARRNAWLAVIIVDIPFVLAWRHAFLTLQPSSLQVGINVGFAALLLIVAHYTLDRRAVLITALASAAMCVIALLRIDAARDIPQTLLVLWVGAALLVHVSERTRRMMLRITAEQVRRDRLSRHFSPELAKQIMEQATTDERQECVVTVMVCDIRGFTNLAEQLTPSEAIDLLNEVHSSLVDILFEHGGTLDKFLGDGMLAYFGAPLRQSDHAERAVSCAFSMQQQIVLLNETRRERGLSPISVGIGLNSGPVVLGHIGPERRREFTIIGDCVNVAVRVESLTKELAEPILATDSVRESAAGSLFEWCALPPQMVKGKSLPLPTFAPKERRT